MSRFRTVLLSALLLLIPAMTWALPAVTLDSNLSDLGGGDYRWNYTLNNISDPGGVNELLVFFNSDNLPGVDYPALAIGEPAGWLHTDPGAVIPPASGQNAWAVDWVDADASDPGVLQGNALSGFSVDFHWSNPDSPPGPQFFEAFGAQAHEGTSITPEPGSLTLMACGIAGLAAGLRGRLARRKA